MPADRNQVKIDLSRDALIDVAGRDTLRAQHMQPDEKSPQESFARAAAAFADDQEHAQRLYDHASKHHFMFATPLLANGGTRRGLPISCFVNYVPDSREGILGNYEECGWLASMGGGIGSYWGALRTVMETTSRGSASSGVIAFVKVMDSLIRAFNQGVTRRGAATVWLDISHPEVVEWVAMRRDSGGDPNRKTLNLNHGVCVPDAFMEAVRAGRDWPLIDSHSGLTKATLRARDLWRQVIDTRLETGEPFIFFVDAANRDLPERMRQDGLHIYAPNLCTEIMLPIDVDRTAVCCLSSVNLAKRDDYADNDRFIDDLMRMLDNALDAFARDAPAGHRRAVSSAMDERSVGLGAMGLHDYFQDRMLPMASTEARVRNRMLFKWLRDETDAASLRLGSERGVPNAVHGSGHRFAHRRAVAPNATSSIVCGNVSPSTEPRAANAHVQKVLAGTFMNRNPALEKVLDAIGLDRPDVWQSIAMAEGSVANLPTLDDHVKDVFRTAIEIDQRALIQLAIDRGPLIDQGQALNLFYPPTVSAKELVEAHGMAHAGGLKSMYYLRSRTTRRATVTGLDKTRSEIDIEPAQPKQVCDVDGSCVACEG